MQNLDSTEDSLNLNLRSRLPGKLAFQTLPPPGRVIPPCTAVWVSGMYPVPPVSPAAWVWGVHRRCRGRFQSILCLTEFGELRWFGSDWGFAFDWWEPIRGWWQVRGRRGHDVSHPGISQKCQHMNHN